MIFTKNFNGTYTIDLDPSIKSTYTLGTTVKVDTVAVSTALPYTTSLSLGVHQIDLQLNGSTSIYKEKKCVLTDDDIECQVVTYLAGQTAEERILDNTSYLYYLVKESLVGDGCVCACDSVRKIYDDLKLSFTDDCC